MVTDWFSALRKHISEPTHIAPLATFRIVFGAMMLFSTLRFWLLGWIETQYIEPTFHFSYFGFDWLPYPNPFCIYLLFIGLFISSLGIFLGFFYRLSTLLFFITFNYIELLDKSYYLNHYYFVSLISLLLLVIPAHKNYALDALIFKKIRSNLVPKWTIYILKFQLFIVYFFAGIAKINSDWLFDAMPLQIWLPAHCNMPILGFLFHYKETSYLFSWLGMLFDLSIVFFMFFSKTRIWAYFAILTFHSFTGYLFQIGVFPLIMSGCMLIFFSDKFHQHVIKKFYIQTFDNQVFKPINKLLFGCVICYVVFQIIFPFRYVLYDKKLFWTEQGYRFSWRVMLMEKAGTANFYIENPYNNSEGMVDNSEFLNIHQEKQMAFQPDMILQYANFLQQKYTKVYKKEIKKIRAEVYVTLNGSESKLFFDPNLNLLEQKDGFEEKKWLCGF